MLQTGAAWFMIYLQTALYVISNVSFCCPQDVPAKALRILFLLDIISATGLLCLLNDSGVLKSLGIVPEVAVSPR